MYSIKRVNGEYLAIHNENKEDIFVVPDDVFTKLVRNGINRNNIYQIDYLPILNKYILELFLINLLTILIRKI